MNQGQPASVPCGQLTSLGGMGLWFHAFVLVWVGSPWGAQPCGMVPIYLSHAAQHLSPSVSPFLEPHVLLLAGLRLQLEALCLNTRNYSPSFSPLLHPALVPHLAQSPLG